MTTYRPGFDPNNASTWNEEERAVYETGYQEGESSREADLDAMKELEPTDRERFLALLKDFGIKFQQAGDSRWGMTDPPKGKTVHLVADSYEEHDSRVDGYTGFFCEWEFDDDGKFKKVGVWE